MTSDRFVIRSWLREKGFQQQQERDHTVSLELRPNPTPNDVILEHKTAYTDLSKSPEHGAHDRRALPDHRLPARRADQEARHQALVERRRLSRFDHALSQKRD
jgi:hypothetical protein